jgi:hypothetical protein
MRSTFLFQKGCIKEYCPKEKNLDPMIGKMKDKRQLQHWSSHRNYIHNLGPKVTTASPDIIKR